MNIQLFIMSFIQQLKRVPLFFIHYNPLMCPFKDKYFYFNHNLIQQTFFPQKTNSPSITFYLHHIPDYKTDQGEIRPHAQITDVSSSFDNRSP